MIAVDNSVTINLLIQSLHEGARPFLQVTSDSMTPLIREGDEIQVAFANHDELAVGDIIVVGDTSGLLAHRYWSSFSRDGTSYLILRGDRIKNFDSPYPTTQIVGRVIARRRKKTTLALSQGIGHRLNLVLKHFAALAVPPPRSLHLESDRPRANASPGTEEPSHTARRPFYGGSYYAARVLTFFVDVVNRLRG